MTDWTSTPSSTSAISSACGAVPGTQRQGQAADAGRALEPAADRVAGRRACRPGGPCTPLCTNCCSTPPSISTLRRAARPSPSMSVAVYACGLVGSSTSVTSGDGHLLAEAVGEQRAALQHRLAVERAADDAEELGGDVRVEHDGEPLARRLGGAEQPGGPLGGVARRPWRGRARRASRPTREAEAGLRLVAVVGQASTPTRSTPFSRPDVRMPVVVATAALAERVGVVGSRRRGCAGRRASVSRSSSLASSILPSVGYAAERRRSTGQLGDGDAVGLGQPGPLVGRAELRRCRGPRPAPRRARRRRACRRRRSPVRPSTITRMPMPSRLGRRRSARPRPRRRGPRSRAPRDDERLDLLARSRPGRRPGRRSPAARSTLPLMPRCRRSSAPSPAASAGRRRPARPGRPCRTCRAAHGEVVAEQRRCRCSTCGPLPMRLPSRSGSVISPFSMRYASVMPNTKSPVAVLTWPPPRWATYTPCSVRGDDVVGIVVAVRARTCWSSAPSAGAGSSGGGRCPTAGRPSLRARR